jgi:hypothetical protein
MRAFVAMRKFMTDNGNLFQRLSTLEIKQLETDVRLSKLFQMMELDNGIPKQGIFYEGQVFDAYLFVATLIKSAKISIVLIDNYIDETVLELFTKRNKRVSATIFTKNITATLLQDLEKHNSQYSKIEIVQFSKSHDRFLIIDEAITYHIGASLKDVGKKWFAFSRMRVSGTEIIEKLQR